MGAGQALFSDSVEALKSQYTDKYVKVDAARPELARFRDIVGQVKTVNMNGRALVEFLDYHLNIGWFDIDLGSLTVVDAPPKDAAGKAETKHEKPAPAVKAAAIAKPAAPPAGEKKLSPLEMARMQGSGAKGGAAAPAKPAAEKPAAPAGKKSTADILAAARGKSSAPAAAAPAAPPASEPPAPKPVPEAPAAKTQAGGGDIVRVDKSSMSIDQMIAYCREHDAK